jgi:hypothetical protein
MKERCNLVFLSSVTGSRCTGRDGMLDGMCKRRQPLATELDQKIASIVQSLLWDVPGLSVRNGRW